jgi:hypothetical protein
VAYDDWPEEFQEVWDNLEATDAFEGMSASRLEYAEFMFEEGWMTYEDEKQAPDDIDFARNEFWDIVGHDYEDYFDWEGWREAMGYDLWLESARMPSLVIGRSPGNERRLSVPRIGTITTRVCGSTTLTTASESTKLAANGTA